MNTYISTSEYLAHVEIADDSNIVVTFNNGGVVTFTGVDKEDISALRESIVAAERLVESALQPIFLKATEQ